MTKEKENIKVMELSTKEVSAIYFEIKGEIKQVGEMRLFIQNFFDEKELTITKNESFDRKPVVGDKISFWKSYEPKFPDCFSRSRDLSGEVVESGECLKVKVTSVPASGYDYLGKILFLKVFTHEKDNQTLIEEERGWVFEN